MAREIDEVWIEEAVARHRRAEALRAAFDRALPAALVTVRSPDGTVEVLVNGLGEIKKVSLLAAARDRAHAELSQSIQSAISSATDAAAWARARMRADLFGDPNS